MVSTFYNLAHVVDVCIASIQVWAEMIIHTELKAGAYDLKSLK